ncbi:hypothetical protein WH91_05275 [Devosia psychrophila]|uniref:Methyltransferase domain-containing protein n=2 Tax=Devosia psychrophila TaxID=728005 RepID=A0A0F5PZB2_9HYPH|nr:hypothetical protein WH91_05275 [Devosia psychrophila]SFD39935.1 Methyltransferase domain-containing protein [Devosia psychrophila]
MSFNNPQKAHYEAMHDDYAAHYYDPTSMAYRREFVLKPLLNGFDLSGQRVADLACGSGHNSLLLRELFPTARFEGFDISSSACSDYEALGNGPAHQTDLTVPMDVAELFDAGIVIGGLHHCIQNLPETILNLSRIIRPGGTLMLYEPNAGFLGETVRKFWYRRDEYFEADTEGALHPAELAGEAAEYFAVERSFTIGGPAYFVILNSLVVRVPLPAKKYLAPPLFVAERLWNAVPLPSFKPAFGMVLLRK